MKIYTSTPAYCNLTDAGNRANPTTNEYCVCEWAGAWSSLTGGSTIDASNLHCHTGVGLWCDTTGEIEPCGVGCDVVPNGTACVGQPSNRWETGYFAHLNASGTVLGAVLCANTAFRLDDGSCAAGYILTSDGSGWGTWQAAGAASGYWITDTNSIKPCVANCCVIPNGTGTADLGATGALWRSLYLDQCIYFDGLTCIDGNSTGLNFNDSAVDLFCIGGSGFANISYPRFNIGGDPGGVGRMLSLNYNCLSVGGTISDIDMCFYTQGNGVFQFDSGINPMSPNDDVYCIGINGLRWKEGWFNCLHVTNNASISSQWTGCFACAGTNGQLIWTSPPGGSTFWQASGTSLSPGPSYNMYNVVPNTSGCLGTITDCWNYLWLKNAGGINWRCTATVAEIIESNVGGDIHQLEFCTYDPTATVTTSVLQLACDKVVIGASGTPTCFCGNIYPKSNSLKVGSSSSPWDKGYFCCLQMKDGATTGYFICANDSSGTMEWTNVPPASSCWEADGPTLLRPLHSECCIVKKGVGTICFGLNNCRWDEGYFDTVLNLEFGGSLSWGNTACTEIIGGANLLSFNTDSSEVVRMSTDDVHFYVPVSTLYPSTLACVGTSGCRWLEGWFYCIHVGDSTNHIAGVFCNYDGTGGVYTVEICNSFTGPGSPRPGLKVIGDTRLCGHTTGLLATTTNSGYYAAEICNTAATNCGLKVVGTSSLCGATTVIGTSALCGTTTAYSIVPNNNSIHEIGTTGNRWLQGNFKAVDIQTEPGVSVGTALTAINNDSGFYAAEICNQNATNACGLFVNGHICTTDDYMYFNSGCLNMTGGTKAAVIEYDKNKYAVLKVDESPDVVFNDHGTVYVLQNKPCKVIFDSIFQRVTEPEYNLQLTPARNDWYEVDKQKDGFVIDSEYDNIFDWHVRKIRKGYKNNRWIKEGNNPFNIKKYKQDSMNTFESYVVQDAWRQQR